MKKMKCIKKMMISVILAVILLSHLALPAFAEEEAADADYKLEQVVVLSRHNLRAPLSSNGSVPRSSLLTHGSSGLLIPASLP